MWRLVRCVVTGRIMRTAIVLLALCVPLRVTQAHELPGTSATLVVREGGFVELRLQLPWSELLHRQWMPGATPEQFLTVMVNQPAAVFAKRLLALQGTVERELRLIGNGTRAQPFTRWEWPSPASVQGAMRTELMARLAMPGGDHHAERMAARAELRMGVNVTTVQWQSVPLLGPTLVTAYRPVEQWVGTGARSTPIPVGRK